MHRPALTWGVPLAGYLPSTVLHRPGQVSTMGTGQARQLKATFESRLDILQPTQANVKSCLRMLRRTCDQRVYLTRQLLYRPRNGQEPAIGSRR